jgi:hypothetical protein
MRPVELLLLYVLVGAAVATASWRAGRPAPWLGLLFWPLTLPGLLEGAAAAPAPPSPRPPTPPHGRVQAAVAALGQALEGWPGHPASQEALASAERGLMALDTRLSELEAVLAALEAAPTGSAHPGAADLARAREENLARLRGVRDETRARMERGLAHLADLTTRAHLARFTGEEAAAVAEALARLAAAVDGAAEVSRLQTPR